MEIIIQSINTPSGMIKITKVNERYKMYFDGRYISPLELLSYALNMDGVMAWKTIHYADILASSKDNLYWKMRDAVCMCITTQF
jgi:hypothetical protein